MVALFQALITYPSTHELPTVTLKTCDEAYTCTTTKGEKIRLACIYIPELAGEQADSISAKATKDYLNDLISGSTVTIRRINEDVGGNTIAELFKGPMNVHEQLIEQGYASIYERYKSQCEWSQK